MPDPSTDNLSGGGSLADSFDAPWTEPVRGLDPADPRKTTDVKFARVDMEYLSAWANGLRDKRIREDLQSIQQAPGVPVESRIAMKNQSRRQQVGIYEIIDLWKTGDGCRKYLIDGMIRAGNNDPSFHARVLKRIPPGRQLEVAHELCSEPLPTIDQFRLAIRKRLRAEGMAEAQIMALGDDQLIELAARPPKMTAKTFGDPDVEGADAPLSVEGDGTQSPPSTSTSAMESSGTGSAAIPESLPPGDGSSSAAP